MEIKCGLRSACQQIISKEIKTISKYGLTIVNKRETDLNTTRSAIAAGYSEKTAEAAASRLLRNVKVSAEVANDPRKQHGNGAKAAISEAYARSGRLQASKES